MSSYPELQLQRAEQPKQTNTRTLPGTFLLSAQFSFLFTMDGYDSDTNTEYTIIIESPIPAEGPILSASTGRKDGSVCEGSQTEGRRDITGPDDVLLSAPLCESSLRRWPKLKLTPLGAHRKFSDLEGRLDKLECAVGSLKSTHLYIVIQLETLDKRVDDLEKDEIRDAIKG